MDPSAPADGAAGIDGEAWASYGENLESNLDGLIVRLKSNSYRAPAVRRKHIHKAHPQSR